MARLQDFQSVTPTANDKFLIVQSQGQGLAPHTIKMDSSNPTGTGSLSLNRKANTTTGAYSATEGFDCEASGARSHAEGSGTKASATASHSEGTSTTASGDYSHAEGVATVASGARSHTEGTATTGSGTASHAEGVYTIAQRKSQHVFGEYNIADTTGADGTVRGSYFEIVGKGTADNARSNARTLDWSGNEVLAGDLTVNGSDKVATDKWIKIVSGSKSVISSGTLTAGSYGYLEVSVVIPSCYMSTGLAAFAFGHPANAGGLSLTGTLQKGQTGTKTMYISYYTPRDIAAGSTDFIWNVECIKTDANINP